MNERAYEHHMKYDDFDAIVIYSCLLKCMVWAAMGATALRTEAMEGLVVMALHTDHPILLLHTPLDMVPHH